MKESFYYLSEIIGAGKQPSDYGECLLDVERTSITDICYIQFVAW